ncbi:hypothetical protein [Enterococcus phage EFap02]|nr:hypothetical protein [Enterococcus phage EFap02]
MIEEWKDIKGFEGKYYVDIANGEYNYYNSINECARELGLHQGNVVSCLKGKRKTCGGYTFKYKEVD